MILAPTRIMAKFMGLSFYMKNYDDIPLGIYTFEVGYHMYSIRKSLGEYFATYDEMANGATSPILQDSKELKFLYRFTIPGDLESYQGMIMCLGVVVGDTISTINLPNFGNVQRPS